MLRLGDLDTSLAGSDEAQKIGGVLGLKELGLRAANDRKRRASALDHRNRIEPPELLPEMRVEAQRPARIALGVDRLPHRAARDKVENEEVIRSEERRVGK